MSSYFAARGVRRPQVKEDGAPRLVGLIQGFELEILRPGEFLLEVELEVLDDVGVIRDPRRVAGEDAAHGATSARSRNGTVFAAVWKYV